MREGWLEVVRKWLVTAAVALSATGPVHAQPTEVWNARVDGPYRDATPDTGQWAAGLTRDVAGNVVVTGGTWTAGSGSDIETVAYDPTGALLWRTIRPGPLDDEAVAVVPVPAGGTVVGGYIESANNLDFVLLGYDPGGVLRWEGGYDGPGHGPDRLTAVAIDGDGNAVATGYSCFDAGEAPAVCDFATVSYDASGVLRWTARYDRGSGTDDKPFAIAVDGDGNVFVAGYSCGDTNHNESWDRDVWSDFLSIECDFAVVAYDTAGVEEWVQLIDGPAGLADAARDIVVAPNGDIVAAGSGCAAFVDGGDYDDWCTANDLMLVRFGTDGSVLGAPVFPELTASDDYAAALAVAADGGIYVLGHAYANDSSGIVSWIVRSFDTGGAPGWDFTYVDRDSMGRDQETLGVDIGTAPDGHLYAAGWAGDARLSEHEYVTMQIDPATGAQNWVQVFDSPVPYSPDEVPVGLVADDTGVVLSGSAFFSETYTDMATIRYDPAGTVQWEAHETGPAELSRDEAQAVAIDADGRVFTAGVAQPEAGGTDWVVRSHDGDGNELWSADRGGFAGGDDAVGDVQATGDGGAVVAGATEMEGGGSAWSVVRYDADGVEFFAIDGHAPGAEGSAEAVAIAPDGSLFVTGTAEDDGGLSACTTIRYSADGTPLWTASLGDEIGGLPAGCLDVAATADGGVVVAGGVANPDAEGGDAVLAARYDASGGEVWTLRHSESGCPATGANAVALGDDGRSYVLGTCAETEPWRDTGYAFHLESDLLLLVLDEEGRRVSSVVLEGPADATSDGFTDVPVDVFVDPAGAVDVVANCTTHAPWSAVDGSYHPENGFCVFELDAAGAEQWIALFDGAAGTGDHAVAAAMDEFGHLTVTGVSPGAGTGTDMATVFVTGDGEVRWELRYDGPAGAADWPSDVAVGADGTIVVVGSSTATETGFDFTTVASRPEACAGCTIEGVCRAEGEADPAEGCRRCLTASSTTAWSSLADGLACDDGDRCTTEDSCSAGVCLGTEDASCGTGGDGDGDSGCTCAVTASPAQSLAALAALALAALALAAGLVLRRCRRSRQAEAGKWRNPARMAPPGLR
ncbi:MAG: SBBP repeat-containing protein [Deltaproteobacteria bacterium]|nr:SBBP repeat-containing protein [Deltaproteobacteria bacterium]